MTDTASTSEKDLKLKVNELRTQITRDERELRSLFNELRLHRTNMGELKEKEGQFKFPGKGNGCQGQGTQTEKGRGKCKNL